uniref:Uncharacterized protein n=1 Tax=Zea mays TaxID=4577 RepID=B6TBZ3_MAIZE|nr:hypothetical protein [Zea mays]
MSEEKHHHFFNHHKKDEEQPAGEYGYSETELASSGAHNHTPV